MKLRFGITPVDGEPYEVVTNLGITVAWERKYKRRSSQVATEGLSTEELLFMAHEAAKVSNIPVPMTLDGFIAKIDDYTVEPVDVTPTEPASTDTN